MHRPLVPRLAWAALAGACLIVACPALGGPEGLPANGGPPPAPRAFGHDGAPPPEGPGGPPGFGIAGEERPPPYLMGLKLTEDQEDKIFAILHSASPDLRRHLKAAHKAREALRDLARSASFDDGKAGSLAQTEAGEESQLALLRTRTDHSIFMVLTPDQRAQASLAQGPYPMHPDPYPDPRAGAGPPAR